MLGLSIAGLRRLLASAGSGRAEGNRPETFKRPGAPADGAGRRAPAERAGTGVASQVRGQPMQRNPVDQHRPDPPRQWGADRRSAPHPLTPPPVSEGRIARGRLAIVLTIVVWACYLAYTVFEQFVVGKA